jgi:hypothetical protein
VVSMLDAIVVDVVLFVFLRACLLAYPSIECSSGLRSLCRKEHLLLSHILI